MTIRERLYRSFEDPTSRAFGPLNLFLVIVTLVAVAIAVLETEAALNPYLHVLAVIERSLAAVFASEYLLRLYAAPKRLRYATSFYGVIDLLSFLPTFALFANFTVLKAARGLRVLRFLRLARLGKVVQIERAALKTVGDDDRKVVTQNALLYLASFFVSVVVLGTLINFVEPETFPGAVGGCFWAMNTLVGGTAFFTVTPVTAGGQTVDLIARFVSMVLLGLLINLVAGTVNRTILGKRERVEVIR